MAKKDIGAALAVLQKGNRTLILTSPTRQQLKKYKKRDWNVKKVKETESATAVASLVDQIQQTVGGGNGNGQTNP